MTSQRAADIEHTVGGDDDGGGGGGGGWKRATPLGQWKKLVMCVCSCSECVVLLCGAGRLLLLLLLLTVVGCPWVVGRA